MIIYHFLIVKISTKYEFETHFFYTTIMKFPSFIFGIVLVSWNGTNTQARITKKKETQTVNEP